MSSRLLAAARVAAAKVARNCRAVGSLPARGFSVEEFIATLKREFKYPETRPEYQGLVNTTFSARMSVMCGKITIMGYHMTNVV